MPKEEVCGMASEVIRRGHASVATLHAHADEGMPRRSESISRLENDPTPNPTMLTFARYAAALGLELHFSAKRGT